MKFGVNTLIWGAMFGPSDFHLLPEIKANGFDGIEVPIFDPGAFDAAAVGRELDRIGLERNAVTIVPGGTSLASSDASVREQARTHLEASIAAARDAGAAPHGSLFSAQRSRRRLRRAASSHRSTPQKSGLRPAPMRPLRKHSYAS